MTAYVLWNLAPGTFLQNVFVPNSAYVDPITTPGVAPFHPHRVDVWIPSGTIKIFVCALHGAGGTIENYSWQMGVSGSATPSAANGNWPMMENDQMAVMFIQGFYCDGVVDPLYNPNGVTAIDYSKTPPQPVFTWNNRIMYSQMLDIDMIADVPAWMQMLVGAGLRMLIGHSNGGMMTQRRFMEHVAGQFTHYGFSSGARSNYFEVNNVPADPTNVKPDISFIAGQDEILSTINGPAGPGDHFFDAEYIQAVSDTSVADLAYPALTHYQGEWPAFQNRVDLYRAANGFSPQTIAESDGVSTIIATGASCAYRAPGSQTIWQDSTGSVKLWFVADSDHHVRTFQKLLGKYLINLMVAHAFAHAHG